MPKYLRFLFYSFGFIMTIFFIDSCADKKKKELQSTAKHKQIAQEQIKRLMSRNKDKIKDPLKYEQKLFGMYLNNTLVYDKDLQEIIEQLDKKIFDSL